MSDNYCFICGHYLADATCLNQKNKKIYIGDHINGKEYSRNSVEKEGETIVHKYDPDTEILYHIECYEILSKRCKYKLNWKDISENIEQPNSHALVPYENIERPPDNTKIKTIHKWSEEQIVEEWVPVIDEIKTKNVELKKEKKLNLQMKRELKREQLRKQRDKKLEKIESFKNKIDKMNSTFESDQTQLENKQTLLNTVKSDSRRNKMETSINRLAEKINKKEEQIVKEEAKLEDLQAEYDLFLKAWF
jgi:hypothetical protein